jgi:hypothetical protein
MIVPSLRNANRKVNVFRSALLFIALSLTTSGFLLNAQSDTGPLASYFLGKEVLVKIDMPASQQGIDLRYNKDVPMNWKEYSGRLKKFGVSIRKGDTARVTAVVVKDDRIEFQLDGGGYGTFGDDTDGNVMAQTADKSDYEKQLQRDIDNTTDPDKKRQLQRDLDRERSRRERQDADNRDAAKIASQIKQQRIADKRLQGGSRFNLRWAGTIPADQKTPEAITRLLAEFVTLAPAPGTATAPPALQATAVDTNTPATAQLKRGMPMSQVTGLFGRGQQLSESVSPEGLKTQTFRYASGDRTVEVIFVEGLIVKYSISSN